MHCLLRICFYHLYISHFTGCGHGKYLGINSTLLKLGSDRCEKLVEIAANKGHEVMVCDNLHLPYRDNIFDAVISIGVIHHLVTGERRAQAVKELARVLRPGGKLLIYVWALEQNHRRVSALDLLISVLVAMLSP